MFRRILRFEGPFASERPSTNRSVLSYSKNQHSFGMDEVTPIPEIEAGPTTSSHALTICQTLLAGGLAGCLSAIVPYP